MQEAQLALASLWYDMAIVNTYDKKFEDAIASCNQALEFNPDCLEAIDVTYSHTDLYRFSVGFLPTPPIGIGFRRRCANGYKAYGHATRTVSFTTGRMPHRQI
ncbi:tetratricopeptide repeat protein [Moorena producens]|uniref:tetratricopeptide repeat protein n=1 Tax=Moorena producens TaxID=1155739 RepID=UPI00143AF5E0